VKRLLALLILIPALAMAGPNDIVATQRNAADTGLAPARLVTAPTGGSNAVMGYNGTTNLPVHWLVGGGLGVSSGALVALPQAWASITGKPTFATVATTGSYADLSGLPALFNGAYGSLSGIPSTFAPSAHTQAWNTITATPTTLGGYGIIDGVTSSTLGSYATTASVTTGLATKFNAPGGTTAQYVRGDGSLATLPVASVPSQAAATRSLNTIFQVSSSRGAWASYSVQLTVSASITGGQNGDVVLEIASDAGFTASVQTVAIAGLGQTYTLAIALAGVQPQTGVVAGYIPAGYYVRLRTVNNTGTPTFSYRAGQETLM
jgi:hypothetical protein